MLYRITRGAVAALVLVVLTTAAAYASQDATPDDVPVPSTPASEWEATSSLIDPGFVVVAEDESNDTAFVVIIEDQSNDTGFTIGPPSGEDDFILSPEELDELMPDPATPVALDDRLGPA